MPARPALLVASAFLLCASRATEVDSAPGAKFNKAELEAILKKEHSDRVSNIYDSENGIQRRRLPNKCPGTQQPRAAARLQRPARIAQGCRAEPGRRAHAFASCAELSGGRPSLVGTRGTWRTRSSVPAWTASAPRKSCRAVRKRNISDEVWCGLRSVLHLAVVTEDRWMR